MSRITLPTLREKARAGERIACLTCYDASFARLLEEAGVDVLLVGDSLGMVLQGRDSTLAVSLEEMEYHTRCVARGARQAFIIADLPFGSYQASCEQALASAARLMRAGAHMVKLEGGRVMASTVRFLVERGIPVCGHLGLLPQSVHQLGGYRVQGREAEEAARLLEEARILDEAGVGLLVLEMTTRQTARSITQAISAPTIGIGAGPDCAGQVLVLYDMLGIYGGKVPKFAHDFLAGAGSVRAAVSAYVEAVKQGRFPGPEHGFD
jgi:3-methyl-2-oxobutanoate hydroxymethyltransferase